MSERGGGPAGIADPCEWVRAEGPAVDGLGVKLPVQRAVALLRRDGTAVAAPLLFALSPPISIYLGNLGNVPIEDFAEVAAKLVVAMVVVEAAMLAWTRRPEHASLALSAALIPFYCYTKYFRDFVIPFLPAAENPAVRLAVWGAVTITLVAVIQRVEALPRPLVQFSNRTAVLLIVILPFFHGEKIRQLALGPTARGEERGGATNRAGALAPLGAPDRPLRDVYYILVDEYGRDDVLKRLYQLDNGGFLADLEARGFVVARDSRSNYIWTKVVMSSLLFMDYPHRLFPEDTPQNRLIESEDGGHAFDLAAKAGYRPLLFAPAFPGLRRNFESYDAGSRDRRWMVLPLGSEYAKLVADMTPIGDIVATLAAGGEPETETVEWALESLPEIAKLEEPTFAFVYLRAPHSPFRFEADGRVKPAREVRVPRDLESFRRVYRDQVLGLNRHLLEAIDGILRNSPRAPVIVIQADHGPRPERPGFVVRGGSLSEIAGNPAADVVEPLGIFSAAHLPEHRAEFHGSITPVNTFRMIFREFMGYPLPPLEDRSYYSFANRPLEVVDVTHQLGGGPAGQAGHRLPAAN